MKDLLKTIGNFFKKVGLFIWKYLKICWNYIKENAWIQPIALVILIFALVFGFQGIVNGIEKIKANSETKKDSEHDYIKLTMAEAREKISNGDDFVLFIGAHDCGFCEKFKPVIDAYIKSTKNDIYYIDVHDSSDYTLELRYELEWFQWLQEIETRTFSNEEGLSTPTVVVIRGGKFVDAKSGAQGLDGGMEYLNFVKFVEGEYIGKTEPTA